MEPEDSAARIKMARIRFVVKERRARDMRTRLAQEVVAAVASGMSVTEAAAIAAVTRQTVYTWRSEFPLHTLRASVLEAHGLVSDDRVDRAG